jgi:hypothetical protein
LTKLIDNSISIHVRRGDYLNHESYKNICGLNYYCSAIRYIKTLIMDPFFIVFSDDILWCKENLNNILSDTSVIYVDWNTGKESYKDMQLISNCKHNIIANSSFSWWGAWLNTFPNKIIIAPKKWLNTNIESTPRIANWLLM